MRPVAQSFLRIWRLLLCAALALPIGSQPAAATDLGSFTIETNPLFASPPSTVVPNIGDTFTLYKTFSALCDLSFDAQLVSVAYSNPGNCTLSTQIVITFIAGSASAGSVSGPYGTYVNWQSIFPLPDVTPPVAPSAPDLVTGSDAGISSTDNITNDPSPTFTGTAEPHSTVSLHHQGNGILTTTTADASGNWTITYNASDGIFQFYTKATDAAGNVSPASPELEVVIDTVSPAPPSHRGLHILSDAGDYWPVGSAYDSDNITMDRTPTLQGFSDIGLVSLSSDRDGPLGTTFVNVFGSWQITAPTLSTQGTHVLRATVMDVAGNVSDVRVSTGSSFVLDYTPPTVSQPYLSYSSDTGVSQTDQITNPQNFDFLGTTEPNIRVVLWIDGRGQPEAFESNSVGDWTHRLPFGNFISGVNTVRAYAVDVAGNQSASTTLSFTVDRTIPVISGVPANIVIDNDPGQPSATVSWTAPTATDNISLHQLTSDHAPGETFPLGVTTVTYTAEDAVYNRATRSFTVTVNSRGPDLALSTTAASPHSGAFTVTANFTGDVTGFDLDDIVVGNGTASALSALSARAYSFTVTPTSNGIVTVDVGWGAAVDGAGGESAAATQLSVTTDSTNPGLVLSTNASSPHRGGGAFTVTASFDEDVSGFDLSYVSVGNGAASGFVATSARVYSFAVQPAADGVVSVTVAGGAAQDAAGNGNTAATGVSVVADSSPPPAPSVPDLAASSDTGVHDDDDITTDTTPSFSGTSEPGSTVHVVTGPLDLVATSDASGNWSIDWPWALFGGTHLFGAYMVDGGGYTSNHSAPITVTIDLTPPTLPGPVALKADSDSGPSNTDNVTNVSTPILFGWSAEAGASITIYSGATALGTATVAGNTYWELTTPTLADGVHSVTGRVTDLAGNVSDPTPVLSLTIDTTKPATPSAPSLDGNSDSGVSSIDAVTNITLPTLTGRAAPNELVVLSSVVSGEVARFNADGAGDWSYTFTTAQSGTQDFSVQTADLAGNLSDPSGILSISFDTSSPTIAGLSTSATSPHIGVFSVGISFSEAVHNFDLADISVSNGAASNLASSGPSSFTFDVTPAGIGTTTVTTFTGGFSDLAGNLNAIASQTPISLTINEPAPDLALTSTATSPHSGPFSVTATFTKDVTGFDLTDVQVGNGAASGLVATSASVYTFTVTPALDGVVTVDVAAAVAQDGIGNDNTAAPQLSVTVDITAPAAPVGLALLAASDLGVSDSDGVTKATTPTITGSADAGSMVTVFDGATQIGTAVATGGSWSFVAPALSNGTHAITATATDAAGNVSGSSTSLSVTIDTVSPSAPGAPDLVAGSDSGSSDTDNMTNVTTPTFVGTVEANASVELFAGQVPLGTTTADGGGSWSLTTAALGEGVHQISARQTDLAGNISAASSALTLTIDTSVGLVTANWQTSTGSGTHGDFLKTSETPRFYGTSEPFASIEMKFTDGWTETTTADAQGAWSANWSYSGLGVVYFRAFDVAGNVSASATEIQVHVDGFVPSVAVLTLETASDSGFSSTDGITRITTPALSGRLSSMAAPWEDEIQVAFVSSIDGPVGSVNVVRLSASPVDFRVVLSALSPGTHTISVLPTDHMNHPPAVDMLTLVIDTQSPGAPTTPDLDAVSDSGSSQSDDVTNDTTPSFGGTAEAGSTVELFSDTGGTLGTVTANAQALWSLTSPQLTVGVHSITARATDAAGNVSDAPTPLVISIDTVASQPVVAGLTPETDTGASQTDLITEATDVVVVGTADPGDVVRVSATNPLANPVDGQGQAAPATGDWSASLTLSAGTNSISVIAVDLAGNQSTAANAHVIVVAPSTAPGTPDLDAQSDTGVSQADDITKDVTPTFTGTADPDVRV